MEPPTFDAFGRAVLRIRLRPTTPCRIARPRPARVRRCAAFELRAGQRRRDRKVREIERVEREHVTMRGSRRRARTVIARLSERSVAQLVVGESSASGPSGACRRRQIVDDPVIESAGNRRVGVVQDHGERFDSGRSAAPAERAASGSGPPQSVAMNALRHDARRRERSRTREPHRIRRAPRAMLGRCEQCVHRPYGIMAWP